MRRLTCEYDQMRKYDQIYLCIWQHSRYFWRRLLEQNDVLYHLQATVDIFGILLDLIDERLKLADGLICRGETH